MAEGRLQCVGSSLFLKRTYGVGYTMTITTTDGHSGGGSANDGDGGDGDAAERGALDNAALTRLVQVCACSSSSAQSMQ